MLGRLLMFAQSVLTERAIAGETSGQASVSPEHAPPPKPAVEPQGVTAEPGAVPAATEQGASPVQGPPAQTQEGQYTGPMVLLQDGTQVPLDAYEVERDDGRKVTIKDGLQFQDDYTRKTQEVAELRRQAEEEIRNAQAWSQWYQQGSPQQQDQPQQQQQVAQEPEQSIPTLTDDDFSSDTERVLYDLVRQQDDRLRRYEQRFQGYEERLQTWDQQAQDQALDRAIHNAVVQSGLADPSNAASVQQETAALVQMASQRISDANNHIEDLARLRALERENEQLRAQAGQQTRQNLQQNATTVAPTQQPPTNVAPQRGRVNWKGSDAQRVRSIQENYPNLVSSG